MFKKLMVAGLAFTLAAQAPVNAKDNLGGILAGVIGAVIVGAVIANIVNQLDADAKAKREAAVRAAQKKNAGASTTWKSNNASGKIKVTKVETMPDGRVCREVRETITFQGKPDTEVRNECG